MLRLQRSIKLEEFVFFFLLAVFHTKRFCPCLAQPTWGGQGTKCFVSLNFADANNILFHNCPESLPAHRAGSKRLRAETKRKQKVSCKCLKTVTG